MLDSTTPSRIKSNPCQTEELAVRRAFELSKQPKSPVQKANSLIFDQKEGGIIHVSHLQHLEQDGAVVVRTFGTDGRLQFATISRPPKKLNHCVDVSLSTSSIAEGQVRILLNKGLQPHYTSRDVGNASLPVIMERSKGSIPSVVTTVPVPVSTLEPRSDGGGLQRLPWR